MFCVTEIQFWFSPVRYLTLFLGINSVLLVLIHALLCSNNQKHFCGGISAESQ